MEMYSVVKSLLSMIMTQYINWYTSTEMDNGHRTRGAENLLIQINFVYMSAPFNIKDKFCKIYRPIFVGVDNLQSLLIFIFHSHRVDNC